MLQIHNMKRLSDWSRRRFNARVFYMLFQAYFRLQHYFNVDDKMKILIVRRATRKLE